MLLFAFFCLLFYFFYPLLHFLASFLSYIPNAKCVFRDENPLRFFSLAFQSSWKNNTLFEIFIFCSKIQLWFLEKIVDFLGLKNSWKCCGFGHFSCWQLWFHEKNCKKKLGEKLVKMLGFCQNWIFGHKFDF